MNAHTPGPWTISDTGESFRPFAIYANEQRKCIADVNSDDPACVTREEGLNARLIAAAPELLAALQLAHSYIMDASREYGISDADLDKIEAAIAKATGETDHG